MRKSIALFSVRALSYIAIVIGKRVSNFTLVLAYGCCKHSPAHTCVVFTAK